MDESAEGAGYLFLDIETDSRVDLTREGIVPYARACSVLVASHAGWDGEPASVYSDDEMEAVVKSALTKGSLRVVCHNAAFEFSVFAAQWPKAFAAIPSFSWRDTMILARSLNLPGRLDPLYQHLFPGQQGKLQEGADMVRSRVPDLLHDPEKIREYCEHDVRMTREVWKRLAPHSCLIDRVICPVDIAINLRGLPIDPDLCETMLAKTNEAREEALHYASREAAKHFFISGQRMDGVDPFHVLKKREIIEKMEEVGNKEYKRWLDRFRELEAAKVKWWHGSQAKDGRVRNQFVIRATHSGRWTGKDLQPQNMAKGTGDPLLDTRAMVKAGPGKLLVSADFRQMELRLGLWMARNKVELDFLAEGRDLYFESARQVLGKQPTADQRDLMKSIVLGIMYGQGKRYTMERVKAEGAPEDLAETFWKHLEKTILKDLRAAWKRLIKKLEENRGYRLADERPDGVVDEPTRLKLPIHGRNLIWHRFERDNRDPDKVEHHYDHYNYRWLTKRIWGSRAYAHVVSGTGADILAATMIAAEIQLRHTGAEIVGHVHDEILVEAPEENALEVARILRSLMRSAGKDCPMDADCKIGKSWTTMEECHV